MDRCMKKVENHWFRSWFSTFLYRDPIQQPTLTQRPPSKNRIKQM